MIKHVRRQTYRKDIFFFNLYIDLCAPENYYLSILDLINVRYNQMFYIFIHRTLIDFDPCQEGAEGKKKIP